MDRTTAITLRLANQRLTGSTLVSTSELVRWMGMVQSQDYKHFRWAIAMRLREPRLRAVSDAFASGDVLRQHLFRCTVQTVCREDLPWMAALCRERNLRTIQSWPSYNLTEFSPQYLQEATDALRTLLQGGKSLTKAEIGQGMEQLRMPSDTPHLNQLLLRGEVEGVVCSGVLRGKSSTWALASERMQGVSATTAISEEEALGLLARKYFQSHSPASFDDFCWWTGLTRAQCRKGVERIAPCLQEIEVEGHPMFLYQASGTLPAPPPDKAVHLLPPYDEYLVGYKSRWVSLDREHEARAHNHFGIFRPVLLYEGRVVGNWKADVDNALRLDTELFARKRDVGVRRLQAAERLLRDFSL